MEKEKDNSGFYGGSIGPWIPIIIMVVGMVIGTIIGGGGLLRFALITFIALVVGFFLSKNKKEFGNIAIAGLTNHMLAVIIMAFLLAGILSQLLRQSGLINGLIWAAGELNLNVGFIPFVAFLTCALISTSCGTSSGSVTAVAPVMIPLAVGLGCDLGLVCGAIISGSIFGDNLAPISDTTIGSALTQEAKINDVVRTRFPFALGAGAIAAGLFLIFGFQTKAETSIAMNLDASDSKALVLLVLPVIMIVLMKKGWDLVSTLIVCDLVGIVLNLALGCIKLDVMLDNAGPIVAGMAGMMNIILYVLLLFQLLEILNISGAFEKMLGGIMKICKTPRSGELMCMCASAIGAAAAGGSSPAVMFFGPMVRQITKKFNIDRTRGANILDATACAVSGLLPYGTGCMLSVSFALACDGVSPNFSFVDILPYNFHCMALLALFFLSILTGVGRRFEKE